MAKKIVIIVGNGFSIDFVSRVKKQDIIDVKNLFNNGDKVPWVADNEPGFLSYKRCPNLWNLGARPNLDSDKSISLIEDIITCAHLYCNKKRTSNLPTEEPNIYIKAYNELASYLRYLFSYYNSLIPDTDFELDSITNWGWSTFFTQLNQSEKFEKITIISYNYDIILERLLMQLGINFTMKGLQNTNEKFELIKPHGSISFRHQRNFVNESFAINHKKLSSEGNLDEMVVDYINTQNYTLVNPIIPPAGDTSRFNFDWATNLRNFAKNSAQELIEHDLCVICGLSYWHVDRNEIDEILLSMDSEINVKMINPYPNQTLNSVISSVFKNYINYTDCSKIHQII
jgi:hypothetical protein